MHKVSGDKFELEIKKACECSLTAILKIVEMIGKKRYKDFSSKETYKILRMNELNNMKLLLRVSSKVSYNMFNFPLIML